jgi:hypothetical protein
MFLNDIGRSPDAVFGKVNRLLESNYGFRIPENASEGDICSIMEQIEGEVDTLKFNGDNSKISPEISKRLLILEGLRSLMEYAAIGFQSPDLNREITRLVDLAREEFRIAGASEEDFQHAIDHAMKSYRSSPYRFPDDLVERRVKEETLRAIEEELNSCSDMEESSYMDEEDTGVDPFTQHAASRKQGVIPNPASMQTPTAPHNKLIPMVRDKSGRMVQDPFAAQAAVRRKGIVTTESSTDFQDITENWFLSGEVEEMIGDDSGEWFMEVTDTDPIANPQEAVRVCQQWMSRSDPTCKVLKFRVTPGIRPDKAMDNFYDCTEWLVKKQELAAASTSMQNTKDLIMGIAKNKSEVTTEDVNMKRDLVKNLRRLLETEVSQAEVMMAAKGFAQEIQEMVEKIGRLQNEDLPPVTDQMRETYGTDSASAFQTQIYSAFQGIMDALYTAKNQVDDAVESMASTGQVGASIDMDKDLGVADMGADVPMDADLDLDNIGDEPVDDLTGDEFGGAEEESPLGREKKMEARKLEKKILEMRKLVEKAKKLKESRK